MPMYARTVRPGSKVAGTNFCGLYALEEGLRDPRRTWPDPRPPAFFFSSVRPTVEVPLEAVGALVAPDVIVLVLAELRRAERRVVLGIVGHDDEVRRDRARREALGQLTLRSAQIGGMLAFQHS